MKTLTAALAGSLAAVAFTACTATPTPNSPALPPTTAPADPTDAGTVAPTVGPDGQAPSTSEGFEGEVSTETITANQMQIEVPKGFKLPENALVTQSGPLNVMMADQDPTATVDAVTSSAAAAGYTVYKEAEGMKVFVGHGNAVQFVYAPGVQMLNWGPESMKDVLATG